MTVLKAVGSVGYTYWTLLALGAHLSAPYDWLLRAWRHGLKLGTKNLGKMACFSIKLNALSLVHFSLF